MIICSYDVFIDAAMDGDIISVRHRCENIFFDNSGKSIEWKYI